MVYSIHITKKNYILFICNIPITNEKVFFVTTKMSFESTN